MPAHAVVRAVKASCVVHVPCMYFCFKCVRVVFAEDVLIGQHIDGFSNAIFLPHELEVVLTSDVIYNAPSYFLICLMLVCHQSHKGS